MCGIAGVVQTNNSPVSHELITRMRDVLFHRGPDDQGIHQEGGVGLVSCRLKIIDLSPAGHQPMSNEDGTLWLTYNGEIYNFAGLRADLLRRGHRFRSHTDTEVILHAYEEFGEDCLQQFNGMFAFALWDGARQRLFCARDRIGIKPFYYYLDRSRFVFASEIKAILQDPTVPRRMSLLGISNYFTFGHSVAPDTLYEGIHKLLPGHYLIWEHGTLRTAPYWSVRGGQSARGNDPNGNAGKVRHLLRDAVRLQMVSDVPLGVFLSGGLDSSTVVAFASEFSSKPVQTFSVGFAEARYSELEDARVVARHFGTNHHELVVTPADLEAVVEKLAWHFDEPFADTAAIPVYLLAQFARKTVTVVLTGEGGDELFGGYRRYVAEQYSQIFQALPAAVRGTVRQAVVRLPRSRRFKKMVAAMSVEDPAERYASWLTLFDDEMKRKLFHPDFYRKLSQTYGSARFREHYNSFENLTDRLQHVDLKTRLPDTYLEKMDKATMAHSLEARVPLLDHRIVELAFALPAEEKVSRSRMKIVLRRAMRDLLPRRILRKPKRGFTAPTDLWFRDSLKRFVSEVVADRALTDSGLFNPAYIREIVDRHMSGAEDFDWPLYLLMAFALWHRAYIRGGSTLPLGPAMA